MTLTVLHIDSSPLNDRSFSRKYSAKIVEGIQARRSDVRVITRDYGAHPLPHLSSETIDAFNVLPEQHTASHKAALKLSDDTVADLIAADIVVIGAPMWNFGIPSSLKAWIDHIIRAGKTFRFTSNGVESLLPSGKRAIIASSRGGVYSEGPAKAMDHQETHLQAVLQFLGFQDIMFVRTEGVATGAVGIDKACATADRQMAEALRKID